MPNIFVEEYRKELSLTGYPFSVCSPLFTDTGYVFAIGTIEDASIYCESSADCPVFSVIEKSGQNIKFVVGHASATFDLNAIPEVLIFYAESGVFSGIFVLNSLRVHALESWKDGIHTITNAVPFCPRCLELVPPVGVSRMITDSGEIVSGDVVISGGYGATLQLLVSSAGVQYIAVNFVGNPVYISPWPAVPVQRVICSDTFGTEIALTGDESKNVSIIASTPFEGDIFDDVLRVEGFDNVVRVSLGGK